MIHSCTFQKHQLHGYRYSSQVCFHRQLFANPVKLRWCITSPVGPLGSTNQNWLYARLLPMTISIYLVFFYIPAAYWEHSTTVCALMARRAHLRLAHPPPPPPPLPPTHLLISNTCDITGFVKIYLKNQQWILHSRVSYETLTTYKSALLIQQILHGYNAVQENHSCFNISKWQPFLEIQNVITWSVFPNPVTYTYPCNESLVKSYVYHD